MDGTSAGAVLGQTIHLPMSKLRQLRVLIADDEPLARQRLEDLADAEPGADVVGLAEDGRQAVSMIKELNPDLVFLDVQMPGLTGMEVVRKVGIDNMPPVIFVTAYDQYAIKAFDVAALDYLLKPFDDERFHQAFERARETLELRGVNELRDRLSALLTGAPLEQSAPTRKYLERLAVEMRGQVRVVPVNSIEFITASGSYAELHVGDDTFVIRERMQTLEERLDPDVFFRIHRSAIVRLDQIESLLFSGGGDYAIKLKDGRHLKVSRGRKEELEERLGLDALE